MRPRFPLPVTEAGTTIGYVDKVNSLAPFEARDAGGRSLLRFQSQDAALEEVRRAWRERT